MQQRLAPRPWRRANCGSGASRPPPTPGSVARARCRAVAREETQAAVTGSSAECVECLQRLGLTVEQSELAVQRAFGWGAKARSYWRHEKANQPADVQQVEAVLQFLEGLGMTSEQVHATISKFPEALGLDVATQLEGNVQRLRTEWRLQGDVLLRAVLRNPFVLGYTLDCAGDCAGECNRCWARF